jgi:hypothetical protein
MTKIGITNPGLPIQSGLYFPILDLEYLEGTKLNSSCICFLLSKTAPKVVALSAYKAEIQPRNVLPLLDPKKQ